MLKTRDNTAGTIVYSKDNCMKCKTTEKRLTSKGVPYTEVNISGDHFDDYVNYLKDVMGRPALAMPVVMPDPSTGLEPWCDLQMGEIEKLVKALS